MREFWTDAGFMVFVDLTEEEDEELDNYDGNAGIEITSFGSGQFRHDGRVSASLQRAWHAGVSAYRLPD